ncbi:hypothetical protein E1B28_006602 [Marasmius oreades]|uniref:Uncharacterized protein n=1 Tax=Marasmius oreades TaxID=181124 RepID=A0A9P7UWH0_9AGAR|nr:uncharacterized protein E1B28_006602 [Marasmius oreades]KAG7095918.1 hypothetical protein E1B28_006602 [Marasmius oreades]
MNTDEELGHLQATLQGIFQDDANLAMFLEQKGEDAQNWLDRLQVLVDYPNVLPHLRSSIFKVMIRLSKSSGLHPKCLSIQNVHKLGAHPIASGGSGDVWKGVLGEPPGRPVCLKVVKVYLTSDIPELFKEYLQEAIVWRQLKHPNLLPFLGMYYLEDETQFCLVSPWMDKGNLVQFLRATQREHVNHHALVYDVASGLAYLHSRKFVHGDLKGVNILITPDCRACIGDFGLSRVADTHGLRITTSHSRPAGTARWLAPELLVGGGRPSKESDIYAFGCVCYEIFTGVCPFPDVPHEITVAFQVVQGRRPSRPQEITELSDAMWTIMESCWNANTSSRPTAVAVVEMVIQMDAWTSLTPASNWNDSIFTRQIWNNVQHPPLLSACDFNREQGDHSQHNLLLRLIGTEQSYLNLLEGIIKKVAAAWSRDNMPPILLDGMFRTIERVYRSHRTFCPKPQESNASSATLEDTQELMMRWPKSLGASYTFYVQSYHSGLDDWEPVTSNTRLGEILSHLSLKKITGGFWTLDELFLLPIGRLKYFKQLYTSLLEYYQPSHPRHRVLLDSIGNVERILGTYHERKDTKAGSSSSFTTMPELDAMEDEEEGSDGYNLDMHINSLSSNGSALHGEVHMESGSESRHVIVSNDHGLIFGGQNLTMTEAHKLSLKREYQYSRSPSPDSPSKSDEI